MAELKFDQETQPYDLSRQLGIDIEHGCIIIDVGRNEHDQSVYSLKHVSREVELFLLSEAERLSSTTKLYVVGDWNFTFDVSEATEALEEASDPWKVIEKHEESNYYDDTKLTWHKIQTVTREEEEWNQGVATICRVTEKLSGLKEVTWISTLPFTDAVWGVLPTNLTKLVVDIGKPVRLNATDSHREIYISQDGMKPLVHLNKLEELRIFGMRDSFQSIIWETVYNNKSDNKYMRVLDLQMASRPLVREEVWRQAKDVGGLTVAQDEDQSYKGIDGKGILHHSYGHGEYLDDLCMRRARIAANLHETLPLPLWCLRLDGFVVDHLPFELELSQIVLLSCGENCVDAGLRAPKTAEPRNKWGCMVQNAITHCMIDFPAWAGIFDAEGRQLDELGNMV
ncbi:hypothetical protein CC78DRAFT_573254 [Lojkania enalia]|uniref:Uncharacterized protein n=1 Tax=Lojkania enalia TaxID=147567 RepID=A0A9P4TRR1_9PLEO|nr:hypothetical protein CC78DRAFT_573254 [Didymosphaeria enalia]